MPGSQVVDAKENFLKEIKGATPVNTQMNVCILADMEKIRVVWIEDQTRHQIPFSQRLIQSKALTLFKPVKTRELRKLLKEV